MEITFWGVCGGIPSPPSPQLFDAALAQAAVSSVTPEQPTYYGGNTSCVSVQAGGQTFIFDLGTGARLFGRSLHRMIRAETSWPARVCVSHAHLDHISGFPFFGPIYRDNVELTVCGPPGLGQALDSMLRIQHKDPRFASLDALVSGGASIWLQGVQDGDVIVLSSPTGEEATLRCGQLNHPDETVGYRLETGGRIVAYTADNEGKDAPSSSLVSLAKGADVWITECQFTNRQYDGDPENGLRSRRGEGHSKPEHVIAVAKEAKPQMIVVIHHDPDNGPEAIREIAAMIQDRTGIPTKPAREGETLTVP